MKWFPSARSSCCLAASFHCKYSANDLTKGNFLIKFHYKYLFEMEFFAPETEYMYILLYAHIQIPYCLRGARVRVRFTEMQDRNDSRTGIQCRMAGGTAMKREKSAMHNEVSNCKLSTNYNWTDTSIKPLERWSCFSSTAVLAVATEEPSCWAHFATNFNFNSRPLQGFKHQLFPKWILFHALKMCGRSGAILMAQRSVHAQHCHENTK